MGERDLRNCEIVHPLRRTRGQTVIFIRDLELKHDDGQDDGIDVVTSDFSSKDVQFFTVLAAIGGATVGPLQTGFS